MSDEDLVKAEAMTPDQLRAARVLLGWSVMRLAALSGTSPQMVTAYEQTGRLVLMRLHSRPRPVDAVAAVRVALEAAGISFIPENGKGASVRLRKPDQ